MVDLASIWGIPLYNADVEEATVVPDVVETLVEGGCPRSSDGTLLGPAHWRYVEPRAIVVNQSAPAAHGAHGGGGRAISGDHHDVIPVVEQAGRGGESDAFIPTRNEDCRQRCSLPHPTRGAIPRTDA